MPTTSFTPNARRFTVAPPIGQALSLLPKYPGSMLLVAAINATLSQQLPGDVTALLHGKRLSIRVSDARLAFDFIWNGTRFAASAPWPEPDLAITASAHDFLLLARRQCDPDTLFFSRRLVMEGDTELGLIVKNSLDALEMPVFNPEDWKPSAVIQRFGPGFLRKLPPLPIATPFASSFAPQRKRQAD